MKLSITFDSSRSAAEQARRAHSGPALTPQVANPDQASILRGMQRVVSLKRGQTRMYEAAQTTRLTSDFGVSIASANAQILTSRIAATARARTLERDNPYAARGLNLFQNNVCGDMPFVLEMNLGKKNADGAFIKETDLNDEVKAAWEEAGDMENCTVRRDMTRDECYWQAITALVRDGGVLWREWEAFPNNPFSYAIEPIEIDRLDHWWNRPAVGTNNEIQFGIERDKWRGPVAYWILTRHPGDVFAWSNTPRYRERVPSGDIIFLSDIRTRAGQDVAMPRFSSVITGLHRIDQYDIAEMSAAIAASCFAGFLVRKAQQGTEFQGDEQDNDGNKTYNVEPGTLMELDAMQDFKKWDPTHPTDAYPHFTKQNLRRAAVGLGLSYHSLAEDYESVNFSSVRASLLENRREFKKLQRHIIKNLVKPHFKAWLKYAMLSGKVSIPMSRYDEVCRAAKFIPTRWEWVDPLKDCQANIMSVEAGFDSRQRIVAESERGGEFSDVCREQQEDNDTAEAHKLDFAPTTPTIQKGPPGNAEPGDPASGAEPTPKNGGKQPARGGLSKRTRAVMAALLECDGDEQAQDLVIQAFFKAKRNGKGNGNGHPAGGQAHRSG